MEPGKKRKAVKRKKEKESSREVGIRIQGQPLQKPGTGNQAAGQPTSRPVAVAAQGPGTEEEYKEARLGKYVKHNVSFCDTDIETSPHQQTRFTS